MTQTHGSSSTGHATQRHEEDTRTDTHKNLVSPPPSLLHRLQAKIPTLRYRRSSAHPWGMERPMTGAIIMQQARRGASCRGSMPTAT